MPADVADADQVEAATARIENELGPIEVWVNNAMTTVFAPVAETPPSEFKRATEVTYLGTVYGTMAALGRMLPRNEGGARLPVDSSASGLLRRETRHRGFHGFAPHRADPRRQEYSLDDGAASGDEYAAVHLVPL